MLLMVGVAIKVIRVTLQRKSFITKQLAIATEVVCVAIAIYINV